MAHNLSQEGSEPVQKYNLEKNIIAPQIEDQGAKPILSEPGSEGLNISQEDLIAYYEKEAIQDKKNIAKLKSILGE